jgi:hypothetical protein
VTEKQSATLEQALTKAGFASDTESLRELAKLEEPPVGLPWLISVEDRLYPDFKHWLPVPQVAEALVRFRDARGAGDAR